MACTWMNPLTVCRPISLRARNFSSEWLMVNDASGNPIEIAAAIVWRVVNTARSVLNVDDYRGFVAIQAKMALCHLATVPVWRVQRGGSVSSCGNAGGVSRALSEQSGQDIVSPDEERVAQKLSTRLVVRISERGPQPVLRVWPPGRASPCEL